MIMVVVVEELSIPMPSAGIVIATIKDPLSDDIRGYLNRTLTHTLKERHVESLVKSFATRGVCIGG